MKNRVLVLLIVLALSAVSGLSLVAAQEGTVLKAMALDAVSVLAEPNADAEVLTELEAYEIVVIVGTDQTGTWLEIELEEGTGFAPLDSFAILDLPLLAETRQMLAGDEAVGAAVFAAPDLAAEYVGAVKMGTVVTVLTQVDEFIYFVDAEGSMGWTVGSAFVPLPEGAQLAKVYLDAAPELGVFVEPMVGADLQTTLMANDPVYIIGEPTEEWYEVQMMDGSTGYVIASGLEMVPGIIAETEVDEAQAGLYTEPEFMADLLVTLPNGLPLYYLGMANDFWAVVYHPVYGEGYILLDNLSNFYMTVTVPNADSIVRAGPNDNVYNAIAVLAADTTVIVKGQNEAGTWIEVALPFSELDYAYYGVSGWMRDYLFVDGFGVSTVDAEMLSVTE